MCINCTTATCLNENRDQAFVLPLSGYVRDFSSKFCQLQRLEEAATGGPLPPASAPSAGLSVPKKSEPHAHFTVRIIKVYSAIDKGR